MTYYAVLDTNVLVSALMKDLSVPGMILNHAINGAIIPLYSREILREYREVLRRPKFHFSSQRIDKILTGIQTRGISLEAAEVDIPFIDISDIVFYGIVMEKRKEDEAWLVTGNIKHFPKEPFVVTPREMLDLIEGKGATYGTHR